MKCWKNSTNEPFATDRTTARWCCASCNVNSGTEPIINETVRQETQNILTAQALNDLYVDNVISPENDDPDYSPCSNIQDRYFDSEDIKTVAGELVNEHSKYLMTMCVNVWSLNMEHFTALDALIHSLPIKPKVIAINETWLTSDDDGPHNNLPGYTFKSNCRKKFTRIAGGGVGLYIKNDVKFSLRDDLTVMDEKIFESIFIDLYYGNKTVTVGTIYRRPDTLIDSNNKFFSHLIPMLKKLKSSNKDCYIMGDQNYNLLETDDPLVDQFVDEMFSESFYSLINHPTRIIDSTKSILDHIWTNVTDKQIISGIMIDKIADHLPVFQITELEPFTETAPRPFTSFSIRNLSHLRESLSLLDISNVKEIPNLDEAFETLHRILDIALQSLPKQQAKNSKSAHWYDNELYHLKRQKENTYRKYIRTRKNIDKVKCNEAKIKYFSSLSKKKNVFLAKRFFDLRNDLKGTWKLVNSLLGKSKKSPCISLEINGKVETDASITSNYFNTYFSNVAQEIRSIIQQSPRNFKDYLPRPAQAETTSCFLFPTDVEEIKQVRGKMKPKRSFGLDKIPPIVLKYLPDNILEVIATLINRSFQEGTFPNTYKASKVVPIYKNKGSRKNAEQYRPVSLINSMSKIIEKIVYQRISSFLNKKNFFSNKQFGFRKRMSTSHAISLLVNTVTKNMNKKSKTLGIFLDLSRAFDLVDHNILLYKLNHYGIRGVANDWFRSYLSNRTQQVEIDGQLSSNICNIIYGTPQGSVLAPLLFLIFINDLPNCLEYGDPLLFADDTNVLISHTNCNELIRMGNKELANIENYLNANKLFPNTDKTKVMIFRTNNTRIPSNLADMKIYGKQIDIVSSLKFLGVMINDKLSWKLHMQKIKSKLRSSTGVFSKIRHLINEEAALNLYHSMVECHLRYGIDSWCFGNSTLKNSLIRSCNRFLQMIFKTRSHSQLESKMEAKNILSLDQLLFLEIGLTMFKIYNNSYPSALTNLFTPLSEPRITRSRNRFLSDTPRIQLTKQALGFKGPKIWDYIPNFVKYSNGDGTFYRTLNDFKTHLRSYIVSVGIPESKRIINEINL